MTGGPNNRRRRRGDHEGHDEAGMERWLLTYSDMITLLLALFIVLWSISSVNISKFAALSQSLRQAFNGKIVNGQQSILDGGTSPLQPQGALVQITEALQTAVENAVGRADLENLRRIKEKVDAYASAHGLSGKLSTSIDERGLVIRLLTDQLLFDTGQAVLKRPSLPVLARISRLLVANGISNPVRVEGNTDNVPISTAQFHSNWELSTARATAVLSDLLAHGVPPSRLSVAGYADQRPVAPNTTAAGRARNRRVDLVVLRRASS